MKTRSIVFSFDDRSLESLKKISAQESVPSACCQSCKAWHKGAHQEYKEITVRNPETGEERVIVIPKH